MSSRSLEDERLPRRWLEAYEDLRPRRRDVQRAYAKFVQRRRVAPRRATALQVTRWLLLGAVLGAGSAFAATGPLRLWSAVEVRPLSPPAVTKTPKPSAGARAEIVIPAPPPATSAARLPAAFPVSSAALVPKPGSVADETWQRAARGLRERDFETANSALEEIARRGSGTERESAELVRAQLLLAQGRAAAGHELLRALLASAKSLRVRQKAGELLARSPEAQPARRSFEPLPASKQP